LIGALLSSLAPLDIQYEFDQVRPKSRRNRNWNRIRIRFVVNCQKMKNAVQRAVLIRQRGNPLTDHPTPYTLLVVEMAHSSYLIIGGTIYSAQSGIHINNKDSGMQDFMSVQKSILIDDPMKDFKPLNLVFLMERFMTRPNAIRGQSVTLIPARPFDRIF
jgi:hypothetical protein